MISRGVRRLLANLCYSTVTEVSLLDGRRADIVGIHADGTLLIAEIKVSVADFRADNKWREYRTYCDRFFFAIGNSIPTDVMPSEAGLIVADFHGGIILRDCQRTRLAPSTRRAMTLRFAQTAADRLHRLNDPRQA
jgi:hypothetical protein